MAVEHRIGERVRLIREGEGISVRIRDISTGYYFNFTTSTFDEVTGAVTPVYEEDMSPLFDTPLEQLLLLTFPPIAGEFLVEYREDTDVAYEIHRFGGAQMVYEPEQCRVYGNIRDVSGAPISGQRVEVSLNRGGYFPHKSGLIGTTVYTLTDDSGYFEVMLVPGLDVVISIPSIGFTQRGLVPPLSSVEIKNLLGRV